MINIKKVILWHIFLAGQIRSEDLICLSRPGAIQVYVYLVVGTFL